MRRRTRAEAEAMLREWHEVGTRKDLPWSGRRVLFERRDGFRFYGHVEWPATIVMRNFLGTDGEPLRIDWFMVKRWMDDGTEDAAEERNRRALEELGEVGGSAA